MSRDWTITSERKTGSDLTIGGGEGEGGVQTKAQTKALVSQSQT